MLRGGKFLLSLERPLIMGIVNLTPDSFSGDGLAADTHRAVEHAWRQIDAGADLIDLGAESSRPGAIPATLDEELERLLPVLEALAGCPIPISVDTYKPEVMHAALAGGASMINDIFALRISAFIALACRLAGGLDGGGADIAKRGSNGGNITDVHQGIGGCFHPDEFGGW